MTLRALKKEFPEDWADIEQEAHVRMLQAHPEDMSPRYYNQCLKAAALDYLRKIQRGPSFVSLDEVAEIETEGDLTVTLDISQAFSALFTPEVAKETMEYLLKKVTGEDLATKHYVSRAMMYNTLDKRIAQLRERLKAYAK